MISTHLSLLVVLVYVYIITSFVQTVNQIKAVALAVNEALRVYMSLDTVVLY
jgi:hypothetical protein